MKYFKLKNLELYAFITLFIFSVIISLYFYSFLKTNIYAAITSGEVILDAKSIRISDVNLTRFEEVSSNIDNKAISQKVNSKSVFE